MNNYSYMSAIDYKVKLDESNDIIKRLETHNKNLDALNKQHYNLYMETQLKFERLQDELLIFHAEVRGHKINWEDMFYSEPDIGCDYKNEFQSQGKNKERKKRSHSI